MAEYISNETKAIKVGEIIPDIKVKPKTEKCKENLQNKIKCKYN